MRKQLNIDSSDYALELSKKPLKIQKEELNRLFDGSTNDGIKVAIDTIEILKENSSAISQSNDLFLSLCDKGIESLNSYLNSSKELSEENRNEILKNIMKILEMANDSNERSVKSMDKHSKFAVGISIATGVVSVLGTIAAIITSISSNKND